MVFESMTLISNFRGHLLGKATCSTLQRKPISYLSFFHVSICLKFTFFLSNLQAGGWSMTQKSPTNEDASDVIVIWFRDAGITYLQDERFNCWQAVILPCFTARLNFTFRVISVEFRKPSDSDPSNFRIISVGISNSPLTNYRLDYVGQC